MRIFLFETDPDAKRLLSRLSISEQHETTQVSTFQQLTDGIASQKFEAYVIDLDDGAQRVIDLIGRTVAQDPTFTAIVTSTDDRSAIRALEAGASLYLPKPLHETEARLKLGKLEAARRRSVRSRHLLGHLILDRSDLRLKVAERERFLTHLIDAAPLAIYSTDHEGLIISFNRAAEKMYGYRVFDIVGQPVTRLYPEGESPAYGEKTRHVAQDGTELSVMMEHRQIVNEIGNHVADLHIVEDVSDREKAENQLLQADRLSTLGQLAPQVAHEFKTPIQVITAAVDLTRAKLGPGHPDIDTWLQRAIDAALEMNGLVMQMMVLGKPKDRTRVSCDLGAITREVLGALEPMGISKHMAIDLDVVPDVPQFEGDPVEIGQVIRNLVINAMHAMESTKDSRLLVRVFAEGDGVVMEVEDKGTGISPDLIDRVFEPFFTTKDEGRGTGLGLSVVKKVLDRHKGTVEVSSDVGAGTTFRLFFPGA